MTRREAIDACLSLPDAYEDYPFDGNWAVMRHQTNRKMFAAVYDHDGRVWINVKAEPGWADFWKSVYPAVVPAYHMNKDKWISIMLDRPETDETIKDLLTLSYELTKGKSKNIKS